MRVEAYGARSALRDLAQVSVRDGRSLTVSVFDPAVASAVEKAIRGAGLNLNPVAGADGIRVPVPRADRSAREALQKVGGEMGVAERQGLTRFRERGGRRRKQRWRQDMFEEMHWRLLRK